MASYKGVAECAICCGGSSNQRWNALECGHVYHQDCLDKWLEFKRDCPSCRVKISKRKQPLELFLSSVVDASEADVPMLLGERDAQVQELQDQKQQLQEALDAALDAAEGAAAAEATAQDRCKRQEEKLREERSRNEALKRQLAEDFARSTAVAKEKNLQLEQFKTQLQQADQELRQEQRKRKRLADEVTHLQLLAHKHMQLDGIERLLGSREKLVPAAVLAARNSELQAAHARVRELEQQLATAAAAAARSEREGADKARRQVEAAEKERDEAKRQQLHGEVTISKLQAEKQELAEGWAAERQQRQELQALVRALAGPQDVAAARAAATNAAAAGATSSAATAAATSAGLSRGTGLKASMHGSSMDCWSQGLAQQQQPQQVVHGQQRTQQRQQQQWQPLQAQAQQPSSQWEAMDGLAAGLPGWQHAEDDGLPDIMVPETQMQDDVCAMSPAQQQWQSDEGPGASSPFAAPSSFLGKASASGSHTAAPKGTFIRTGPDGMGGICRHLNTDSGDGTASNPWSNSSMEHLAQQVHQPSSRLWAKANTVKKPSRPLATAKPLSKPKAQPITRFFCARN